MHLGDRLGFAQRVIVVIALGLALGAAGTFLVDLGSPGARIGWYGYAPLTRSVFTVGSTLAGWEQLLVWLALILVWAGASLFLLRPKPRAIQAFAAPIGDRREADDREPR